MKIKNSYPPNYDELIKHFDIADNPNIIFTYGNKLYVPNKQNIPDDLIVHESIHMEQQKKIGVKEWWNKYIFDIDFRIDQEAEAYNAQYKYLKESFNRHDRRAKLKQLVEVFSGPVYGNILTPELAKELITK